MTSREKRRLLERVKDKFLNAETVQCLAHKDLVRDLLELEDFETFRPDLNSIYLSQLGSSIFVQCKDLNSTRHIMLHNVRTNEYATIITRKKRETFDSSKEDDNYFFIRQLKKLNF